jgi:hypothetical protein
MSSSLYLECQDDAWCALFAMRAVGDECRCYPRGLATISRANGTRLFPIDAVIQPGKPQTMQRPWIELSARAAISMRMHQRRSRGIESDRLRRARTRFILGELQCLTAVSTDSGAKVGVRPITHQGAGMSWMMECAGRMWGMLFVGALGIVVLIMLFAALIKYLFFSRSNQ